MAKYKYLIYDFDGTLVNTYEGVAEALDYTFNHYGINVDKSLYPLYIGPPINETFASYVGEDKAYEAVEVYKEHYYDNDGIYKSKPYEGIIDSIKALKKDGYKICVATCKKQIEAEDLLKYYGLYDDIDFVSGLWYNLRETKADTLRYLIETLKIDVKDCVMIGDTRFDVEGAEEVNMDCILCLWGFGEYDKINNRNVVYRAKDPFDVKRYVEE